MARIKEYRDKNGKLISFFIRVHRGRDSSGKEIKPWSTTFEVKPTWSETTARKKAEAFAAVFEKECREGTATDSRLKFSEYCEYVIATKENRGLKKKTIFSYREMAERINEHIGHIKIKDLRVDHLNTLYTTLSKPGARKTKAKASACIDLEKVIKGKKQTRAAIAKQTGLAIKTVSAAIAGKKVEAEAAEKIAGAIGLKMKAAFKVETDSNGLSPASILKHHHLISTVLDQAEKEGQVPFNVAARADLPKQIKHEPNYFQPEQIAAIRDALESESMKWKTIVHLFLITGARRGEILGLKWDAVDFDNNRIHIHNEIMYLPKVGIYEDTPKSERSIRWVSLPVDTMKLLRQYKIWQTQERLRLGEYYDNSSGLLFTKDNGDPMHPDTVTDWLDKFSSRHDLPHINPHAFRHTMASMLYFNGMDSVSISRRLGHAQVSTTANIYAHVIEEADRKNADVLADIFLKKA